MKIPGFILLIVILQTGCAMAPKVHAVRHAADHNRFKGLDSNTRLAVSIPGAHSGPYGSVDQFNFTVQQGEYKDKNASAIMGRSRKTGEWEVLILMIDQDGQWISVPKTE